MSLSPLCAICDVDACTRAGLAPIEVAHAFLDAGARFIQIRAKDLPSGAFLQLIDAVVDAAAGSGAVIVVNDRVDLAKLGHASGVHVGQDDLSPREARAQLGPDAIVGMSTHTEAQIRGASAEPASYVAIGPVFGTATKDTGYESVGLDAVRLALQLVPAEIPIVAIGGITLANARSVIDAGATSVAVISDLLSTGNPQARVEEYLQALARSG